jgi:hypothetical protein
MVTEASCVVLPRSSVPSMDSLQDDDAGSSTVLITVLSATPMRAGKLFALASVTINVGGVLVEIHGIRAPAPQPARQGSSCRPSAMPRANRAWRLSFPKKSTVRSARRYLRC